MIPAASPTEPKKPVAMIPERNVAAYSTLENKRLLHRCPVPAVLANNNFDIKVGKATVAVADEEKIQALFPSLYGQPYVDFVPAPGKSTGALSPMNIGCVLSGGQAAGGHNCIVGLFDYVEEYAPGSKIYGFIGGPKGVMDGTYRILDKAFVDKYRNTGGFDMLTAGRDKIESPTQFEAARKSASEIGLDGLVVIGGDDSNTNAGVLAENFKAHGMNTKVVGLPKTIDGDLKNEHIETSFGFDTAAKLYAECVGNIQTDCASTGKYYHFIRLMGREASHLTLECALMCRPNMTFIGEEVRQKKLSLADCTNAIADMVCARAAKDINYGVVLIPEGLIDFVPEVSLLIKDINELLAKGIDPESLESHLQPETAAVFKYLPPAIQAQLLLDRDPHGNVQVAKIESERLLALLVTTELAARKKAGTYKGKFSVQNHYFGYEGRCVPPTNFDCNYCYSLGLTAAALIANGQTGMMASLRGLTKPVEEWTVRGVPLTCMMNMERRKGKDKPVIRKALTELDGAPFAAFVAQRDKWALSAGRVDDGFRNPGPIQYWGPAADAITYTLQYEQLGLKGAVNSPGSSAVQLMRQDWQPLLPSVLEDSGTAIREVQRPVPGTGDDDDQVTAKFFPHTISQPLVELVPASSNTQKRQKPDSLSIGVVFSGRQTPGGHSTVAGLLRYLQSRAGTGSKLLGFVGGTRGLLEGNVVEVTPELLHPFANQGGFDLLGRTADVLRGEEHINQAAATCTKLGLGGLVIVGGPISNSDAALVAEGFAEKGVVTKVVGIPGTIDGDLKNRFVETSVGFDTACKVYSQLIGNLSTDAASARKYYYFVRLMGRAPSHIALECALQTQPNVTLIGEEIEAQRKTLAEIVNDLADVVVQRAASKKNYGVIIVPEGLIEYIPEMGLLLREISALHHAGVTASNAATALSPWAQALLASLPETFRNQLLQGQEGSTGNAQLNQIETERLLAELVERELKRRKGLPGSQYSGSFSSVCFYLGYQARSSLPSNFDCHLAHTLGYTAGTLISNGRSGYMATAHGLTGPVCDWRVGGVPLTALMATDWRNGQLVPVIRTARVNLGGPAFREYKAKRDTWKMGDVYRNPGSIQFDTPIADVLPRTLIAEWHSNSAQMKEVGDILEGIRMMTTPGCSPNYLQTALVGLRSLSEILKLVQSNDQQQMHDQDTSGNLHGDAQRLNTQALMNLPDN